MTLERTLLESMMGGRHPMNDHPLLHEHLEPHRPFSHLDVPTRCFLYQMGVRLMGKGRRALIQSDDPAVTRYLLYCLSLPRIQVPEPKNILICEDPEVWAPLMEGPTWVLPVDCSFSEALDGERYTDLVVWSNEARPWEAWYREVTRKIPVGPWFHMSAPLPEGFCSQVEKLLPPNNPPSEMVPKTPFQGAVDELRFWDRCDAPPDVKPPDVKLPYGGPGTTYAYLDSKGKDRLVALELAILHIHNMTTHDSRYRSSKPLMLPYKDFRSAFELDQKSLALSVKPGERLTRVGFSVRKRAGRPQYFFKDLPHPGTYRYANPILQRTRGSLRTLNTLFKELETLGCPISEACMAPLRGIDL